MGDKNGNKALTPVTDPAVLEQLNGSNATPSAQDQHKQAFQYYLSKGLQPHVAAGIVGNLSQESGLDPNATNPTTGAYGVGQWLGQRKVNYLNYAKGKGIDPSDLNTQLDYIISEPGESDKALAAANSTDNPGDSAKVWADTYERMGKNEANYKKRMQVANELMGTLKPVNNPELLQQLEGDKKTTATHAEDTPLTGIQTSAQFVKGLLQGKEPVIESTNENVNSPYEHQQNVKGEIDNGINYVTEQANKLMPFIQNNPEMVKTMGDPVEMVNKIINRNGNIKELGVFSNATAQALKTEYEQKIKELVPQVYDSPEVKAKKIAEGKALDETYKQQLQKNREAIYPLAQLKSANDFIQSYDPKNAVTPENLLQTGIKTAIAAGVPDAKELEQRMHEGRLTEMEKLNLMKQGGDAIQFKTMELGGDNKIQEAQNLTTQLGDYTRKALDANPEARKEIVKDAISDELVKNKDKYYPASLINPALNIAYNLKNATTDDMVKEAATNLGLNPADYTDIKVDDLKYDPTVLQRLGKGVYGSLVNPVLNMAGKANMVNVIGGTDLGSDIVQPYLNKRLFGGESPNASSLFGPQTITNTTQGDRNYLEQVPNPQAGNFHPTVTNIAGIIAEGVGNLAGFIGGAGELSAGIKATELIGDAAMADKAGTAAYMYLSSIDDNIKQAKEAIPGNSTEDKVKQYTLGNLYSIADIGGMEITNPLGIKGKIFGDGSEAKRQLVNILKEEGTEGLKQKLPDIIATRLGQLATGTKEALINEAKMTGGMTLSETGHYIADMMLAPDKFATQDNAGTLMQNTVSNAIINMLPAIASGYGVVKTEGQVRKSIPYEIGSNPETYLRAVDQMQHDGNIDEQTAVQRKNSINELADIVKNEVPQHSPITDKELTPVQQQDYTNNLYQERQLNKRIESIKDEVQKGILEKKVEELQLQRAKILDIPIADLNITEAEKKTITSNQSKTTDNEKSNEGRSTTEGISTDAQGQEQRAGSEDKGNDGDKGSQKPEERVLRNAEATNSSEEQSQPDGLPADEETAQPERDVVDEYHAKLIDERAKLLQMQRSEKAGTPDYTAQQDLIKQLEQQEQEAIKANERAKELLAKRQDKNILNPNTANDEKNSETGQEDQRQEANAKTKEEQNGEGQRQGRILNETKGVPVEEPAGAPIKKPLKSKENATTKKGQQQQEGDQQSGERQYKVTGTQRDEKTPDEANNSNSGKRGQTNQEKEKINKIQDLHDQVVELRAKELRMRLDKKENTTEYKENAKNLRALEAKEMAAKDEMHAIAEKTPDIQPVEEFKVSITEQERSNETPKETTQEGQQLQDNNWFHEHNMNHSNKISDYLSSDTLKDIFGEDNDITSKATAGELHLMMDDGLQMVDKAKQQYGDKPTDYVPEMLQDMKEMPGGASFKKAVATIGLINHLQDLKAKEPQNANQIRKLLSQVEGYYKPLMREHSWSLNAARNLRIFRDEYLGEQFAEKILTEKQAKARREIIKNQNLTEIPEDIAEKGVLRPKKEVRSQREAEKEAKPVKETRPRSKDSEYAKKLQEKKAIAGSKEDLIKKLKDEIKKRGC